MISRAVTGNSRQTLKCKLPTQRRHRTTWQDKPWFGAAGVDGPVNARLGCVRHGRLGMARRGRARQGMARSGIAGKAGSAGHGAAWRGSVSQRRLGAAWRGVAWLGKTQTARERAGYK
jgi:hypothetical protein